jgi:hypothetical protein
MCPAELCWGAQGPKGTVYENGVFHLSVDIPERCGQSNIAYCQWLLPMALLNKAAATKRGCNHITTGTRLNPQKCDSLLLCCIPTLMTVGESAWTLSTCLQRYATHLVSAILLLIWASELCRRVVVPTCTRLHGRVRRRSHGNFILQSCSCAPLTPMSNLTHGIPHGLQGAWRPALNIPTVLASIGLLLAEPNPKDGLMADVVSSTFAVNIHKSKPHVDLLIECTSSPNVNVTGHIQSKSSRLQTLVRLLVSAGCK